MDAIIMAGGMGKRLCMDEKPLTNINGKPMIQYVISALLGSKYVKRIFAATSPNSKKTSQWLINSGFEVIDTPGNGFVKDMVFAVEKANINSNVLIIMADLPLVTSKLLDKIIITHSNVKTPALSVYMKLDVCKRLGLRPDTVFHKDNEFIVPSGINILDANKIKEEQEDYNLVLEDEELALNVNTKEDLYICEKYLKNFFPILSLS